LSDLDILVPAEQTELAADRLKLIGFTPLPVWFADTDANHLPKMCNSAVGIDLHTKLAPSRYDLIVARPWFDAKTVRGDFRNLKVDLPDPTRRIVHNVVHHQLNHTHYRRRTIELRQALDLALLRERHEVGIDWQEVHSRFDLLGMTAVLSESLHIGETLFGQPVPHALCQPEPTAVHDLKLMIENPVRRRWPSFRMLMVEYARLLRQQPLRLTHTFRPGRWLYHACAVYQTLVKPKW
jgi:hypothetical protein